MSHLTQLSPIQRNSESIPFEIQTLRRRAQHMGEQHAAPLKQKVFEIIWISCGSGSVQMDMNQYLIQANVLFCVAPGRVRQLKCNPGTEGYVISFSESFLKGGEEESDLVENSTLFDQFVQFPMVQPGEEGVAEMQDIIKKLLKEYENYYLLRSEMLRRYVRIFLLHLKRELGPTESWSLHKRYMLLVRKFTSLLEKNFRETKMVTEYADQLAVSPNYLNEAVKKTFGYPASHLIRQRIVLEAKRKALYSDASMKEIAYSLGFEDVAHFSKFFKNTSGVNFTDFKREAVLSI